MLFKALNQWFSYLTVYWNHEDTFKILVAQAARLVVLAGPHTALHTAVLWWEETRTCLNRSQRGPLSNQETSCSLKATYACKMKFHEYMLGLLQGNPNEILVLSLLPPVKCCKVRLTRVHRVRGMKKVINRVMLFIFTSAISKFDIWHISQDERYTGVNAKEKNICLGERGTGGFHYSPSLSLKSGPKMPLEMRESALHQSIKEAPCLAKIWETIPRITGNKGLWQVLKLRKRRCLQTPPRQGCGPRQRSPRSSHSQQVSVWAGRTSLTCPLNCIPDWVKRRWQEVRASYMVNS